MGILTTNKQNFFNTYGPNIGGSMLEWEYTEERYTYGVYLGNEIKSGVFEVTDGKTIIGLYYKDSNTLKIEKPLAGLILDEISYSGLSVIAYYPELNGSTNISNIPMELNKNYNLEIVEAKLINLLSSNPNNIYLNTYEGGKYIGFIGWEYGFTNLRSYSSVYLGNEIKPGVFEVTDGKTIVATYDGSNIKFNGGISLFTSTSPDFKDTQQRNLSLVYDSVTVNDKKLAGTTYSEFKMYSGATYNMTLADIELRSSVTTTTTTTAKVTTTTTTAKVTTTTTTAKVGEVIKDISSVDQVKSKETYEVFVKETKNMLKEMEELTREIDLLQKQQQVRLNAISKIEESFNRQQTESEKSFQPEAEEYMARYDSLKTELDEVSERYDDLFLQYLILTELNRDKFNFIFKSKNAEELAGALISPFIFNATSELAQELGNIKVPTTNPIKGALSKSVELQYSSYKSGVYFNTTEIPSDSITRKTI